MKAGIHPEFKEAVIRCVCGAEYKTKSTKGDLHVEICANCHPFYAGTQKIIDSAGRVEKFKRKYKLK